MNPVISLIAAVGKNGVIGVKGRLPWRIPDDLKRFRTLTSGHAVIMGRKTYELIGKPLPDRTNIIITRNTSYAVPGCVVAHSIEEALAKAREVEKEEIFIIGGGEVYREAMPLAEKLHLTLVDSDVPGDAFFPPYPGFKKVSEEAHELNGLKYTFAEFERI